MKILKVLISDAHAMSKGSGRFFNPTDSRMAMIIANRVQSKASITYNGKKANLKSGMAISMLSIEDHSSVAIFVEGANEDKDIITVLDALLEAKAISQEEYQKQRDILHKETMQQKEMSKKSSNDTNKTERLEIKVEVNNAYGLVDNGTKHVASGNSYFSCSIEHLVNDCEVWIRSKNNTVNAKSSIGVLSLGIQDGDEIWFVIEGENRYSALATVLEICKKQGVISI